MLLDATPNSVETDLSPFARTIFESKYALKDSRGNVIEDWPQTAHRVAINVMSALGYRSDSFETQRIEQFIRERKFMPGGRYLYATGRGLHQTQNCLLLRADDSREGWSDLVQKATMALMTGAGIGIDYSDIRPKNSPIHKTGGVASGPLSLMKIVNEVGRNVMQGGSRRSAIWAGLSWKHPDVMDFIRAKNWSEEVRALKEKDFNFPATLDMTNISVILDDDFFEAFNDETWSKLVEWEGNQTLVTHADAQAIYWKTVEKMVTTAEPGFSIDTGANTGETLRNAPIVGNTYVLTREGYRSVNQLVGNPVAMWTGKQWAEDVVFKQTGENVPTVSVRMTGGRVITCDPTHEFLVERWRGAGTRRKLDQIDRVPANELQAGDVLHVSLPDFDMVRPNFRAYTLGYIYGDGSFHKAGGADLTLCTPESKRCREWLVGASSINPNDSRGYIRLYFGVSDQFRDRRKDVFPEDVYEWDVDSIRSFVGGLFDSDGNWEPTQKRIRLASKHEAFLRGVGRLLEQLGILAHISKAGTSTYGRSQGYQLVVASEYVDRFARYIPTKRLRPEVEDYVSYRTSTIKVLSVESGDSADVFCADVKLEDHSFMAEGVIISNCTEVTSYDDSDICNLGSVNLARISDFDEFQEVVEAGTLFLLAGTVYSHVPYDKVDEIRTKNRRLGLGLMGIHEWLLQRGKPYGPDFELEEWLSFYQTSTEIAAQFADKHNLSRPVKTRAIAPTGTIGIVAETTTGIEPIFCVAYKRRYRSARADGNDRVQFQFVIDPTAKRLIDNGVEWQSIEDAHLLAYQVERRVAFQAWVQQFVDHGISSTINMPEPMKDPRDIKDFGVMLLKYLPKLRGLTCYPDGARGGQPLVPVLYPQALGQEGVVFEENEESCVGGVCGA